MARQSPLSRACQFYEIKGGMEGYGCHVRGNFEWAGNFNLEILEEGKKFEYLPQSAVISFSILFRHLASVFLKAFSSICFNLPQKMAGQNDVRDQRSRIEILESVAITLASRLEQLEAWGYQRRSRPYRLTWPQLAGPRLASIRQRRRGELVWRQPRVLIGADGQPMVVDEVDQLDVYLRNFQVNREIQNALYELNALDMTWSVPDEWIEIVPQNESPEEAQAAFNVDVHFNRHLAEMYLPFVIAGDGNNRRAFFGEPIRVAISPNYGYNREGLNNVICLPERLGGRTWLFEDMELVPEPVCCTCRVAKPLMYNLCGHLCMCAPCCRIIKDRKCPICRARAVRYKSLAFRIRPL